MTSHCHNFHISILILAFSYVLDVCMHACCNYSLPTSQGVEDLCSKINLRGPGFVCGTYLCSVELFAHDSSHNSGREAVAAIGTGKQMTPFQWTTG
jgi:hypothetical protein